MSESEPRTYPEIDQSKSIGELLELYGMSKPTLYGYFKALSITPARRGRQTYILLPEWEILAALITTLKQQKEEGASPSIADAVRHLRSRSIYIPKTAAELAAEEAEDEEEAIHLTQSLTSKALTSIPGVKAVKQWSEFSLESLIPKFWQFGVGFWQSGVDILTPLLEQLTDSSVPFPEELNYLKVLSAIADKGIELSTTELANLLKLKPKTVAAYGDSFKYAGFTFIRTSERKSSQIAWEIHKPKRKRTTRLD